MSCCTSPWHATRQPSHETACSWQMQVRTKPAGSIKQLSRCPLQWVGRAASPALGCHAVQLPTLCLMLPDSTAFHCSPQ